MARKVKVNWYPGAKQKIMNAPNVITYAIARQTLDRTLPYIPKDTGRMRKTSMAAGVRGTAGHYYIGSYTKYAKYVWVMPNSTNWSEPGTFGRWYARIWKRQGKNITASCVERNKLQ
jgi:hypothetical protein